VCIVLFFFFFQKKRGAEKVCYLKTSIIKEGNTKEKEGDIGPKPPKN